MATTRDRIFQLAGGGNEAHIIAALMGLTSQQVFSTLSDPNYMPPEPGAIANVLPDEKYLAIGLAVGDSDVDGLVNIPGEGLCYLCDTVRSGVGMIEEGAYQRPDEWGLEFPKNPEGALALLPDNSKLFWVPEGGLFIARANPEGAVEVEEEWVPLGEAHHLKYNQLACDGNYLYFPSQAEFIGRVKVDGTGLDETWVQPEHEVITPRQIAVDATYLYFTWRDAEEPQRTVIARMKLDGTGLEKEWIVHGTGDLAGLAVSPTHIYWSQQSVRPFGIVRANIDGTGADQWLSLQFGPNALAVGPATGAQKGEHVWWMNRFGVGHVWLPTKDA